MSKKLTVYESENIAQTVATNDTFSLERYRQFERHLPHEVKSILDVGCAEGAGGTVLKDLRPNIHLVGLDCVQERLDKLPSAYSRSVCGLTSEIPFKDKSFDAIVAGEFLEHLYPSDVDSTLCEFQRILDIKGHLLMTTPNPYSLNMRRRRGTVYGVAHLTQHFPECLKLRLKMHGFSSIKIYGSGRATRYFGEWMPWLSVYGSYLIIAKKV